ncbi:hypothetical protein ACFOOP_03670 [Marinicaulis aureus]|uniref:DUF5667 domain-containing protein n=1 Tax=Hyphococcus aureus TaxID=2666033 RepID=A0ABW1KUG5_9PROT
MKKELFVTAAAILALSSLGATGAEAGKPKEIVAPLAVSAGQAENANELAALWVDGRRHEMTGLAQIEDGEKLIRKGQKDERKATEKLAKVIAISDEQRAAYIRLVAGFGGAATPAAVETEIKALKKAADDWKDAFERVEKAQSNLKDAQLDIANGQSAVRTGNELIASGREKMRRAEIESRPGYVAQITAPAQQVAVEPVEFEDIN